MEHSFSKAFTVLFLKPFLSHRSRLRVVPNFSLVVCRGVYWSIQYAGVASSDHGSTTCSWPADRRSDELLTYQKFQSAFVRFYHSWIKVTCRFPRDQCFFFSTAPAQRHKQNIWKGQRNTNASCGQKICRPGWSSWCNWKPPPSATTDMNVGRK